MKEINTGEIAKTALRRSTSSAIKETIEIAPGASRRDLHDSLGNALFHTNTILLRNASNVACGNASAILPIISCIEASVKSLIEIALKTEENPVEITLDTIFIGMRMHEINGECDIGKCLENMIMRDEAIFPYDVAFAVDIGLYYDSASKAYTLRIKTADIAKRLEQALKESREER